MRNDVKNKYRLTTSLTYAQKRIYATLKLKNKPLKNKLIF